MPRAVRLAAGGHAVDRHRRDRRDHVLDEEFVVVAGLEADLHVAGHGAGDVAPVGVGRVPDRIAEAIERGLAEIHVAGGHLLADGVAAVAAVRALVDDGRDDPGAVLARDLDAFAAVAPGVEAVRPGDRREVGGRRGAGAGDVLDRVDGPVGGAVVAAGRAVAAAVARGALREVVPGERSVAGVVLQRALGGCRGAARAAAPAAGRAAACRRYRWCRRARPRLSRRRCRWCRRVPPRRRRRRCRWCRRVRAAPAVPPAPVVPPRPAAPAVPPLPVVPPRPAAPAVPPPVLPPVPAPPFAPATPDAPPVPPAPLPAIPPPAPPPVPPLPLSPALPPLVPALPAAPPPASPPVPLEVVGPTSPGWHPTARPSAEHPSPRQRKKEAADSLHDSSPRGKKVKEVSRFGAGRSGTADGSTRLPPPRSSSGFSLEVVPEGRVELRRLRSPGVIAGTEKRGRWAMVGKLNGLMVVVGAGIALSGLPVAAQNTAGRRPIRSWSGS